MLKLNQQYTTMILNKFTLTKFNLYFKFFNEWIKMQKEWINLSFDPNHSNRLPRFESVHESTQSKGFEQLAHALIRNWNDLTFVFYLTILNILNVGSRIYPY